MSLDSASSVREAALASICITELTLPEIMKRGRDVAGGVRRAARGKVVRILPAVGGPNPNNASLVSDADTTTASAATGFDDGDE
jgi:hypothetical protein